MKIFLPVFLAILVAAAVIGGAAKWRSVQIESERRQASQVVAIRNNLRMLSAAADQYFVETRMKEVKASELIGPGKFIPAIASYAGEVYEDLVIRSGDTLKITTKDGREIGQF